MKEPHVSDELIMLKKENIKYQCKEYLLLDQYVNTMAVDVFYDSCMIDFSKSKNIEFDKFKNIVLKNGYNDGTLITNEIATNTKNNIIKNIVCKLFYYTNKQSKVDTYIIIDDKEYPIKQTNCFTLNHLNVQDNVNSFRFKIKINKQESAKSPAISGYSIFFSDSSVI